jgi:hypothetical protein
MEVEVVWHVACIREMRNANIILVSLYEGKRAYCDTFAES